MNFEFLQNLTGLKRLYKHCKNAEELALSMPDCSMFSARKSGEALARFIYFRAYKEAAENLSFADILTDYTVKHYIGNRDVLDALHNIRKKGNVAVHEENDDTVEDAIELLEDLHYAAGEIARKERLIDTYPRFDAHIDVASDADLMDFDPAALATEMAQESVAKYRVEKLMDEFASYCAPFHFIPGDVDLVESVEWTQKPVLAATISKLQIYFGHLAMKAIKHQYGDGDPEREITYKATITTFGKKAKTTTDLFEFMEVLMYDLPDADGFKIESVYYGPAFAGMVDDEVAVPLFYSVDFGSAEKDYIKYKCFEFLYNHGEGGCMKFENGKWQDLQAMRSPNILDTDYGQDWWDWDLCLYCNFDFEKHPEILTALRAIVKKHIPAEWLGQCERQWEIEGPEFLVNSINWNPRKLRYVQNFLDEVNEAIWPIKDECDCYCIGDWHIKDGPKATATWDWTDDGFKVMGTEL